MGCTSSQHEQTAIQPAKQEKVSNLELQTQHNFEKSEWDANGGSIQMHRGTTMNNTEQHSQFIDNNQDSQPHSINAIKNNQSNANQRSPNKNINHQQDQVMWDLDAEVQQNLTGPTSSTNQNKKSVNQHQQQQNRSSINNNQTQRHIEDDQEFGIPQDLIYYNENMFVEQAISASLQNVNHNDELEFEKMMQQVMKESKQDHEIRIRKEKMEELQMISQIPELRQQKIQQILSNADQQKQSKLQPLQPLGKGKMAPLPLNYQSNNSQQTNAPNKKDNIDVTRSSIQSHSNQDKPNINNHQSSTNLQQNWGDQDNNNNNNSSKLQNNFSLPQINVAVINYNNNKGAGSKNKQSIAHPKNSINMFDGRFIEGLKDNYDLEGSIDLDDFKFNQKSPQVVSSKLQNNDQMTQKGLQNPYSNNVSKPSLQTTLTYNEMGSQNNYQNDDLDLDELKAFLDDGFKPLGGGNNNRHQFNKQSPKLGNKVNKNQSRIEKQNVNEINNKKTFIPNNNDDLDEDFF
eukprot:403374128